LNSGKADQVDSMTGFYILLKKINGKLNG